jgi:hypothetical protein
MWRGVNCTRSSGGGAKWRRGAVGAQIGRRDVRQSVVCHAVAAVGGLTLCGRLLVGISALRSWMGMKTGFGQVSRELSVMRARCRRPFS